MGSRIYWLGVVMMVVVATDGGEAIDMSSEPQYCTSVPDQSKF